MNLVKLVSKPYVSDVLFDVSATVLQLDRPKERNEIRSAASILEKWGGDALSHFSFSFIFVSSHTVLTRSANQTPLRHILAERSDGFWMAYVTGSLAEYNESILRCTSLGGGLQYIYSQVYDQLRDYLPSATYHQARLT